MGCVDSLNTVWFLQGMRGAITHSTGTFKPILMCPAMLFTNQQWVSIEQHPWARPLNNSAGQIECHKCTRIVSDIFCSLQRMESKSTERESGSLFRIVKNKSGGAASNRLVRMQLNGAGKSILRLLIFIMPKQRLVMSKYKYLNATSQLSHSLSDNVFCWPSCSWRALI